MKFFYTLILLGFWMVGFGQATYYVDATGGDDTDDGHTPSTAWQTISEVNNHSYGQGDKILFKRGEDWVGEQLEVADYSGTSGQPITFGAYPTSGEKPIITVRTNHSYTWESQGGDIWKASNSPDYNPERLWVDGNEVLRANNSSEFDMAIFGWFYDAPENGNLYLKSTTDPSEKQLSYTNGQVPLYIENASYINFENLDFRGGWTSIYINTNSNYLIFSELSIGRFASNGIDIDSEDETLPSYIHVMGCLFDTDFTLDYSAAPVAAGSDNRGCSDGVFLQAADHCEINNCYFKNWGHASINVDGNPNGGVSVRATYIFVHDNYLTSPDICYGGRIGVDDARYCKVYNNQIVNTSVQTQLAGRENHYHHNLIVGTTNPPIIPNGQEISAGISVESYSSTEVFGNIFENNLIANTEGAGFRLTNSGSFDIYDNIIRNNIIFNCGVAAENSVGLNVQPNTADCNIRDNDFLNNLIFNTNESVTINFRESTYEVVGFNALTGTSGFEIKNNIASNPLFLDMANGDFHLAENSPCIDAGTTSLAVVDFDGNDIPTGSAPDIGLYEYQVALPVMMINAFSAKVEDDKVKLTWSTSEEVENDYFVIFRSQDLIAWDKLEMIAPNTYHTFDVLDSEPYSGISYYRLVQKDLDGRVHELGQVSVRVEKQLSLKIIENPVNDELSITLSGKQNMKELKMMVCDRFGQVILTRNASKSVNVSQLPRGVYTLMIYSRSQIWRASFVKL